MKKTIFLILCCAFLSISPLYAAVHAIVPSSLCANNGNGTSWSCAASPGAAGAFNAIPTGSGLTRGDIYYFADGSYGTYNFTTADSGTTLIEFRKAQSYDFGGLSGWNTGTMGSGQAQFSSSGRDTFLITTDYLKVNGNGLYTGVGCGNGPGVTTAVGPQLPLDCGFLFRGTGGTSTGNTNIISLFANPGFSIGDSFSYSEVWGSGTNDTGGNGGDEIFGTISASTTTGTSFSHLYLHNSGCVYMQDLGSGTTVDRSYFWGTEVYGAPGGLCHGQAEFEVGGTNAGVRSNNIYRDITGTAVWTFGQSVGTNNNWKFYNNVILFSANGFVNTTNGANGLCPANCATVTSGNAFQQTSGQTIYIGATSTTTNINSTAFTVGTVYSPTLMSLTSAPGTLTGVTYYSVNYGGVSDALLDIINGNLGTNFTFVQNTVVNCYLHGAQGGSCGIGFGDGASGCSANIENNLWYNNTGSNGFTSCASMTLTEDYNSFLNSGAFGSGSHDVHVASGSPNPFVTWPDPIGNFNLFSDNANWNNRLSLSAPYTLDVNGVAFTTDRGAYQFVSSTQAMAPSCAPGTGTYTGTQTVTCTNPNSGVTIICYSTSTTPATNGSGTGCSIGTVYTTAISIPTSETLTVIAGTSTLTDSNAVSYVYTITPLAPNPPTGLSATVAHNVTLTCTPALSGPTATSFKFYRGLISGGPYTLGGSNSTCNFYDNKVSNFTTTYYYVATGVNGSGEGSNSSELVVTIPQVPNYSKNQFPDLTKGRK